MENHISDDTVRPGNGNPESHSPSIHLLLQKHNVVMLIDQFLQFHDFFIHDHPSCTVTLSTDAASLLALPSSSALTLFPCTTNRVDSFPVQVDSVTILSLIISFSIFCFNIRIALDLFQIFFKFLSRAFEQCICVTVHSSRICGYDLIPIILIRSQNPEVSVIVIQLSSSVNFFRCPNIDPFFMLCP